jgi:carbamoyl-phosphate synthase large subunit
VREPFVSKATGVPWAKVAARVMAGAKLADLGVKETVPTHFSVKEAVFPFVKFPGVDTVLGPEMRSTGEVMGIAADFPMAFAKAEIAAGTRLPSSGTVLMSVRGVDKKAAGDVAAALVAMGFRILATQGTAAWLEEHGIPATVVLKVAQGRPHCVDAMINGEVAMVINTVSSDPASVRDSFSLRRTALTRDLPYFTTMQAAAAATAAIQALRGTGPAGSAGRTIDVQPLQRYHR